MISVRFLQNYLLDVVYTDLVNEKMQIREEKRHVEVGKILQAESIISQGDLMSFIWADGGVTHNISAATIETIGVPQTTSALACCSNRS